MALLLLAVTLVVAIGLGSGLLALFGDPAEDAVRRWAFRPVARSEHAAFPHRPPAAFPSLIEGGLPVSPNTRPLCPFRVIAAAEADPGSARQHGRSLRLRIPARWSWRRARSRA